VLSFKHNTERERRERERERLGELKETISNKKGVPFVNQSKENKKNYWKARTTEAQKSLSLRLE
jgi:hypothetical protein